VNFKVPNTFHKANQRKVFGAFEVFIEAEEETLFVFVFYLRNFVVRSYNALDE